MEGKKKEQTKRKRNERRNEPDKGEVEYKSKRQQRGMNSRIHKSFGRVARFRPWSESAFVTLIIRNRQASQNAPDPWTKL